MERDGMRAFSEGIPSTRIPFPLGTLHTSYSL